MPLPPQPPSMPTADEHMSAVDELLGKPYAPELIKLINACYVVLNGPRDDEAVLRLAGAYAEFVAMLLRRGGRGGTVIEGEVQP